MVEQHFRKVQAKRSSRFISFSKQQHNMPIERFKDRDYGLSAVGKGWAPLVNRAYDEVDRIHASGVNVEVSQVKEKFGALRIYFDVDGDFGFSQLPELSEFLWALEKESVTICEECGQPGVLSVSGYNVKTVCEAHKRPGDKPWTPQWRPDVKTS